MAFAAVLNSSCVPGGQSQLFVSGRFAGQSPEASMYVTLHAPRRNFQKTVEGIPRRLTGQLGRDNEFDFDILGCV